MADSKRRPQRLADLPFPMHRAVRWFSPRELLRAIRYVALSGTFGSYADKREVEAVFATPVYHDLSQGTSMWLDYVSDIGDGFDATYSVAYKLGRPELDVAGVGPLKRGSLLVMGGDQVYPAASTKAYEERTKGPYVASLPFADDPPKLVAVPGNHDWYDGLTAFLRFFCQGNWVGGWQTIQRRSYFAVKLPQNWWLLGIDIQFETYIDGPQIEYFRKVAEEIGPDDAIILCSATPSWVEAGTEGKRQRTEAYATLDYFISHVLRRDRQQIRLMLAGDAHHYSRYAEIGGERNLVTCGGGGAYLSATHGDSDPLILPPASLHSDQVDPPPGSTFDLITSYPSAAASRGLAWRIFDRLPGRNPSFVALMMATQAMLVYLFVLSASTRHSTSRLMERWRTIEPGWSALLAFRQPALLAIAIVVLGGTVSMYRRAKPSGSIGGLLHGVAHLLTAVATAWLFAGLPEIAGSEPFSAIVAIAGSAVLGGVVATGIAAGYLFFMGTRRLHLNELFSAQAIEDYKCFLRMHIDEDGALRLYPLAVQHVCRSWQVSPDTDVRSPWLEPVEPFTADLIEEPIKIPRKADQ